MTVKNIGVYMMNQEWRKQVAQWLSEDDFFSNQYYLSSLPSTPVKLHLKVKSDMKLAGLPHFMSVFESLSRVPLSQFDVMKHEGFDFKKNDEFSIDLELPFKVALCGERLALNLLHHASSIATQTSRFVAKTKNTGIQILDTRKTLPGLRSLEKYAVRVGGGSNHRFSQNDAFMIKDNHKTFFGGTQEAIHFFKKLNSFYTPLICEIHTLEEFQVATEQGIQHFLLDNFSPTSIEQLVKLKKNGMTFEVSGGVTLENIDGYLIEGVDAISTSAITQGVPAVDLSLKII